MTNEHHPDEIEAGVLHATTATVEMIAVYLDGGLAAEALGYKSPDAFLTALGASERVQQIAAASDLPPLALVGSATAIAAEIYRSLHTLTAMCELLGVDVSASLRANDGQIRTLDREHLTANFRGLAQIHGWTRP